MRQLIASEFLKARTTRAPWVLLLHANQVVSSSRLIEELWPDEASDSHAGALQASVSRLRKSLGSGAELLVTLPTGYVIKLATEQLDLDRFERLVQEADDAEPQEAAERLREALSAAGVEARDCGENALAVDAPAERIGEVAAASGIVLHELRRQESSLEEVFLELTGTEARPG